MRVHGDDRSDLDFRRTPTIAIVRREHENNFIELGLGLTESSDKVAWTRTGVQQHADRHTIHISQSLVEDVNDAR